MVGDNPTLDAGGAQILQKPAWSLVILLLTVAAAGAWLLGRRYGLSAGGRLVAAAAFMLSGFCVAHTHAPTWLVMFLLPWSLLGLLWLMERPGLLRLVAVSLLFAAQVFSGPLEAAVRLMLASALFVLLHLLWLDRWRALRALPVILAAGAIGIALAGVQWVPLASHMGEADISAPSPEAPGVLAAAWVGTAPLLLAIGAIVWRGREPRVLLWIVWGLAFALPGLGMVPGTRSAGWLAVTAVSLAMLAGAGLDAMLWRLHLPATRQRIERILTRAAAIGLLAAAAVAVVMVALSLPVSLSLWPILAMAIVAGAAAIIRRRGLRPGDEFASGPWPWVGLAAAELLVVALPPATSERGFAVTGAGPAIEFLKQRREASAQPFRIAAPPGVLPAELPGTDDLFTGRFTRAQRWLQALGKEQYLNHPAARLLNIRYAIVPADESHPPPAAPWRPVFPSTQPVPGQVAVYENSQSMPRAWIATRPRWHADLDAVLERLKAGDLDPSGTVLLEERYPVRTMEPDRRDRSPWWSGIRGGSSPRVDIESHSPRRVELRVSGANAGWLVVADPWMPGWTARVTRSIGPRSFTQDATVVPAYGLLRAINIDQSRSGPLSVVLEYRVGGGTVGVFVSAAGAIVLLLLTGCGLLPRNADSAT